MGFNLKATVCHSRHTLTFKKLEAVSHPITLGLKPGQKFSLQRTSKARAFHNLQDLQQVNSMLRADRSENHLPKTDFT